MTSEAKRLARHARYKVSAKGRAAVARYNASEKRHAANTRYYATEKGRAARVRNHARNNKRRIYIGDRYVGVGETQAETAAINAHIKDRLHVFKERQRDAS